MKQIPLAELRPGRCGTLVLSGSSPPTQRLRDLGFVEGTLVEMVRWGPWGGPVELALRGSRLCLRRRDLSDLWVKTGDDEVR